ncbi:hypothetical protein M430DRAFT_160431 [Amorphotheca resinae ATCC 22711]|uniref:Uncharacterized protein n=1 Tax=Amorphotheca resinae ATCC 22711 TaxID=857342 RepID=A0A2T3BEV1_AMORE|nr:hypothetical protein M430DRAFT_160431 [Amorphotheca resinae ATCC 22711]PSS27905.1 hypothetical protein M430DRAFT_160431 [Amorphotheca resinae ATCC 22711]
MYYPLRPLALGVLILQGAATLSHAHRQHPRAEIDRRFDNETESDTLVTTASLPDGSTALPACTETITSARGGPVPNGAATCDHTTIVVVEASTPKAITPKDNNCAGDNCAGSNDACKCSGYTCTGSNDTCNCAGDNCTGSNDTCNCAGYNCAGDNCPGSNDTCKCAGYTCARYSCPGDNCAGSNDACNCAGYTCAGSNDTCACPGYARTGSDDTCKWAGDNDTRFNNVGAHGDNLFQPQCSLGPFANIFSKFPHSTQN